MKTSIIQDKHCPLCKKTVQGDMYGLKEYWYCTTCELGWIKKIPAAEYQETYYQSGSSIIAKLFNPIEHIFYSLRNSYAGKETKKLWIDIGAGDGKYLKQVRAKKKIGVEISKSGREKMKQKGLETLTNNAFLKTNNLKAECISFWQVAEHLVDPWRYFDVASRNLKQSGIVIVAVPNCRSLELKFFKKYWFHLAPQYHIWHFSPNSMTKMLAQHNLKVISIDYWALEHHSTGTLQSLINWTTKSEDILHKLVKRRQNFNRLQPLQILGIIFWCTLGLPFAGIFWIIASLSKRSGTFVVVATKM